MHGLKEKSSNHAVTEEIQESMKDFFEKLKNDSVEHATRLVRGQLGRSYLRDNEDDTQLPSHWTKRKVYERWVWECGWAATSFGNGAYSQISEYAPRSFDQTNFIKGIHGRKPVISKKSFESY